jgi:hypothetical protein
MSEAFARAKALMSIISMAIAAGNHGLHGINTEYRSRGKGEGCNGNKRAKSSFKQNKRRGL